MRGSFSGALERTYLHSVITEGLWCAVVEAESMFGAKLAHAVMLSSLYGNPSAELDKGNDQIHKMYIEALDTIPYIKAAAARSRGRDDALVEEWHRVNAEEAAKKAAEKAAATEVEPREEGGGV